MFLNQSKGFYLKKDCFIVIMDRKRSFKGKQQNSDRNDEDRGYGNRDSGRSYGNRNSGRSFGNRDGNRSFGNRDGNRSFGNRDGNSGDFKREMHKATCAECGNECTVPFKPVQDKPVYCRDCFMKRKKF